MAAIISQLDAHGSDPVQPPKYFHSLYHGVHPRPCSSSKVRVKHSSFILNYSFRWNPVDEALTYYCQYHLLPEGVVASCDAPPTPPPPPPPMGYGAFACGMSNGKLDCENDWASVFNGLSNIQAQEVVLDYCPSCSIVVRGRVSALLQVVTLLVGQHFGWAVFGYGDFS